MKTGWLDVGLDEAKLGSKVMNTDSGVFLFPIDIF